MATKKVVKKRGTKVRTVRRKRPLTGWRVFEESSEPVEHGVAEETQRIVLNVPLVCLDPLQDIADVAGVKLSDVISVYLAEGVLARKAAMKGRADAENEVRRTLYE